jgi:NAD(P)-dependent dehydrogenase (short-subunit alcohol dehydrogenase family)
LPPSGRERRDFLGRAALTAGGTAAALLPTVSHAQPPPAAPASCPNIPTPMKEVAGKVAFVTGGNSGIGLGIARALVDADMKVAITYRSKEHLDEAMSYFDDAKDRVHAINVDVTDRAAMAKAAEETVAKFGKVHVLVNNAGVGIIVPLSSATYDDWDWGRGVNVNGVFNGVRSFLPHIKAHNEGGQIVTTSSMSGLVVGATAGVYSTSKFAVVGMMEALRVELANTNIGVSVYCPGLVNSNIRRSDRNRPKELSETGLKFDPRRAPPAPASAQNAPSAGPGMDPLEAGQRVLRGIRNNDLYILTHPEFEQGIRDRNEALIASIPVDPTPPPAARVEASKVVLRTPIYYNERDRKLCERAKKA